MAAWAASVAMSANGFYCQAGKFLQLLDNDCGFSAIKTGGGAPCLFRARFVFLQSQAPDLLLSAPVYLLAFWRLISSCTFSSVLKPTHMQKAAPSTFFKVRSF